MRIKFQSMWGNFFTLEINPENEVSGDYTYMYAKLSNYIDRRIKKGEKEPYIPNTYFADRMKEARDDLERHKKIATELRQEAPNSTTYTGYSFYRVPQVSPDLDFLYKINKQLIDLDKKIRKEQQEAVKQSESYSPTTS